MKTLKIAGSAVAGVLLIAASAHASAPPALYTDAQATAGAEVFAQNCAMCHGSDMKGSVGPALIGQSFASVGSNTTVGSIFTVIAKQMPINAPGSLSQTQDEQAMAYILKQNGYPSGSTPLSYNASSVSTVPLVSMVK